MKADLRNGYALLHKGVLALSRAERQGIRIDAEYIKRQERKLTNKINALEKQFLETDFCEEWRRSLGRKKLNIGSTDQLSRFLYDVKGYKPVKETAKGKGSSDGEALRELNIPELDLLLQSRKLLKLRDTYLAQFVREEVNGYIHPFFNLHTVTSYRSSSDSPNFQNIPVRDAEANRIIRRALFPRPGHQLLELDYKALEVSISACYSEDPALIKYVSDPSADMHRDLAYQLFLFDSDFTVEPSTYKKLRYAAKNGFVFPQFYGDYYKNNAKSLTKLAGLTEGRWKGHIGLRFSENMSVGSNMQSGGIRSYTAFIQHVKDIEDHFWNKRFHRYRDWKEKWWRDYQYRGYFDTLTGFRCGGLMTKNQVTNLPFQGSAFHCLLWSFIELDRISRQEQWKSRLIGQIHDSIILDVYPPELQHVMETAKRVSEDDIRKYWDWIIVPLKIEAELCSVDGSWYEKEEVEI